MKYQKCIEENCSKLAVPSCCWCCKHCGERSGKEFGGQHYPRSTHIISGIGKL